MIKWLMRKLCTLMVKHHKYMLAHSDDQPVYVRQQLKVDVMIWELRLRTIYGDKETKSK